MTNIIIDFLIAFYGWTRALIRCLLEGKRLWFGFWWFSPRVRREFAEARAAVMKPYLEETSTIRQIFCPELVDIVKCHDEIIVLEDTDL